MKKKQGVLPKGTVAVKKLFMSSPFSEELFQNEVRCLMRARHSNIVRFLGYCSDTQGELMEHNGRSVMAEVRQRLLVFEYCPNGSLQSYLKEKCQGNGWKTRYRMMKGICQGLHYLHQERINHLDINPGNVMLDANMGPKITDFGLSRWFDEGQSRIITADTPGTRGYIAPEMIDKGEISFKSDIFSLGIIFIKLLTGGDHYEFENWHKSVDVDGPEVKSCIEIARTCVDADQHNRPCISEIIDKLNQMENDEESRDDDLDDNEAGELAAGNPIALNQMKMTMINGGSTMGLYQEGMPYQRQILHIAAAVENSMARQQQITLMQLQHQQNMTFYLFLFLFLYLCTVIIIQSNIL